MRFSFSSKYRIFCLELRPWKIILLIAMQYLSPVLYMTLRKLINIISIVFTRHRKGLSNQPLFLVPKPARVFLVDTMQTGTICVHKFLWTLLNPFATEKRSLKSKTYWEDRSVSVFFYCLWLGSIPRYVSPTCCNCRSITFWMSKGGSDTGSGLRNANGENGTRWWLIPASEIH